MSLSLLFGGLFAGFLHVLMGPDHLAAVAPSAALRGRDAWRSGLRWGIGHSSGVLCVGIALILLRQLVDISKHAWIGERFVGVALIAIGIWGIRVLLTNRELSLTAPGNRHHHHAERARHDPRPAERDRRETWRGPPGPGGKPLRGHEVAGAL